MLVREKDVPYD